MKGSYCGKDVTLIVVTSPAPSNPSTELITRCIESCKLIDGLDGCPVIIMMDGFKLSSADRTKVGRITEESAGRYELYHRTLLEQFSSPRYSVVRNKTHLGFALTVKAGLELCKTTYCLVAQYDRTFCAPFNRLGDLINSMEVNTNIRYIGFPTSSNINHDKFISTNYNLACLNKSDVKLYLGEHLYLQPVVFWYDSQHLGHVQRYLEIFTPYKNMPVALRETIGILSIKGMVMRPGDFIEDRFGQMQRRLLTALATTGIIEHIPGKNRGSSYNKSPKPTSSIEDAESQADMAHIDMELAEVCVGQSECLQSDANNCTAAAVEQSLLTVETSAEEEPQLSGDDTTTKPNTPEALPTPAPSSSSSTSKQADSPGLDTAVQLFRWYGSYLCWTNTSATPYEAHTTHTPNDTVVMVCHLRGRQLDSSVIAKRLATLREGTTTTSSSSSSTSCMVSPRDSGNICEVIEIDVKIDSSECDDAIICDNT